MKSVKQSHLKKMRKDNQGFLQNDLHSTVCPEKKKIQLQGKGAKNINDSSMTVCSTFCKELTHYSVSYSTFCKELTHYSVNYSKFFVK